MAHLAELRDERGRQGSHDGRLVATFRRADRASTPSNASTAPRAFSLAPGRRSGMAARWPITISRRISCRCRPSRLSAMPKAITRPWRTKLAIMPNHELCRADLTPPKRRAIATIDFQHFDPRRLSANVATSRSPDRRKSRAKGLMHRMPAEHKARLIELRYIEEVSGGLRLTGFGRMRIAEGK